MDNKIKIISFQYNDANKYYKKQIKHLTDIMWPSDNGDEAHLKEFNVMSFCACLDNEVIGYAGVIRWDIPGKHSTYKMSSLSCVCTHPKYQNQGIGKMVVQKATKWIVSDSCTDVGLFTCSPELTTFYEKSREWKKDKNLVLKESDREGAYISSQLELDVLKILVSDEAKQYFNDFTNTTIVLNFPKGEFI
ncbi:MAG: GNAT family N-acetyltransferase [Romboutsia sp.]|uniref:GNAT family N-acetyltransferase n=1 Tax=Romboutsia sp. TaxID=1965302 RepID=UPI003F39080D